MKSSDVTDTLNMALEASGCDSAKVIHKPRLLSDNCSSYISGELANWLSGKGMDHVRGAPMHPQIQGKIASRRLLRNRLSASGDVGIRPSRTASCSKTITCPAILNKRSLTSSATTTT